MICLAMAVLFSPTAIAQKQTEYTPVPTYTPKKEFAHFFRLSATIGASSRTAKATGDLGGLAEGARKGTAYTFQFNYAGESGLGAGLFAEYWQSKQSETDVSGTTPILIVGPYGSRTENWTYTNHYTLKDNMFFIGPCFFVRAGRQAVMFNSALILGYYGFNSKLDIRSNSFYGYKGSPENNANGATLGVGLDLSLDVRLYKSLCLGGGFNLLTGSLSNLEINGVKTDLGNNKESLARFTSNIGLKLWL